MLDTESKRSTDKSDADCQSNLVIAAISVAARKDK